MNKKKAPDLNPASQDNEKMNAETSENTVKSNEQDQAMQLEKLSAELEKAKAELCELKDHYMRTLAEYDNFRKRSLRERESLFSDAQAFAITAFLPVYDNLERAAAEHCADASFKKGVEMTLKQFRDALERLNVKEIAAAGETFNPDLHNALMHIDDEALPENSVAEVFQKGFQMGDKVLRHASVKVAN